MENEYFEKSMFLCEYKAIKEFAKNFAHHFKAAYDTQWSIVCERKEDLITVRNQVLYEIEKEFPNNEQNCDAIFGISMYTLDNLARNFCATFASIKNKELINEIPNHISKPYLDIISQELLVQNILNFYGYIGNDSLPLAKQILSLIDTQWPPDTNFVHLIISTQNKENLKTVQEINEKSLRQILASYQYAAFELENYSRLQNLVKNYLHVKFTDHLFNPEKNKYLVLPNKFLSGNILWVSAPEFYIGNSIETNLIKASKNTIKTGNFQRFYVDEFKNYILKTRDFLKVKNNTFITSRTIITQANNEMNLNNSNISYIVTKNRHCYSEKIESLLNEKNSLCLLADFDPGIFKETRPDAAGSYSITMQTLKEWENNNTTYTDAAEIFPQIDSHFEKFLEQISLIDNEEKLKEIGKIYLIESQQKSSQFIIKLFYKYMEKERVNIGIVHPIFDSPRALSFFSSSELPQKIYAIGRAHAPTSSSFHVKVLNNAISILRKQGVTIDLPASEMMYRGFWKNLTSYEIPIEFWLENSSELNNFPKYLTPQGNVLNFGEVFLSLNSSHLIERFNNENIFIPYWKEYLNTQNQKISITSFERYINCPLQFFLSEVIGIKKEEPEALKVNHMEIGSKMHLIAEQLITRLVTYLGNKNYGKIMLPIFSGIIEKLKNETVFLSFNKRVWLEIFNLEIEKHGCLFEAEIKNAFIESIECLWQKNENNEHLQFIFVQQREILKRTFFRFLQIEKIHCEDLQEQLTGIERERPVTLELAGLSFVGKIDRIDATLKGLKIIDYKTSNISKTEKKISLLPSELLAAKTSKLCPQGALYCLAWAQKNLLEEDDENYRNKITSFSLYHLKNLEENLNPILSYEFTDELKKDSLYYKKLLSEYTEFALRLKQGDFYPKPIKSKVCDFCDFKTLCPVTLNHSHIEDNSIDENL